MPDSEENVIVRTEDGKFKQYNIGDLVVNGSAEATGVVGNSEVEVEKNPASASSSDIETEPEGKQNGTATLQNEISTDKVSEKVGETQGIDENTSTEGGELTPSPLQGSPPISQGETRGELNVIPIDEKGEPMYESASVEATINDIYNDPDLDEEEADAFVQAKIDGATKRIAQLEKKKPKMGESKVAFKEAKAKWREQLESEQSSLAYWQGVQEAVPEMRRKERAKRQMEADIAQREREQQERAEQAQRAEERGRNRGDYRKAMTQWEDAPNSFHEYVAQALLVGDHKMRWNDNGMTRGLGSHTTGRRGTNRRGEVVTARNDEARAMSWLIDDRNGVSPEALADRLRNDYTGSYGEDMAEGSPLDVLLDVVTSMPTPQSMWDYVKGEHDARMDTERGAYEQQYSEAEIEAMERDAMYREKYGVSEDEYWAREAELEESGERKEDKEGYEESRDEEITDARALATEAVVQSLEGSGIEVVQATDAMAEAMLALGGVELMAIEEAKRRADAIEGLTPINVTSNNKSKEELSEDYKNLPSVEKDGRVIEFYNSAFKKIYKDGGLFAQVVPQLDEILEQSVLAYSEKDNLGGIMRPDGSTHKEHPNVTQFLNYVGKVEINGKEYYVRTTVQEEKSGQTGTHAYMVTEVSLYENTTEGLSLPITTRARGTFDGVVDTKLQQFFDYANGKLKNPEFHIVRGIFGNESGDEFSLTQEEFDKAIDYFQNYSTLNKSADEIFRDIRKMGRLNNDAYKGYGALTTAEKLHNYKIYKAKDDFINKVIDYYIENELDVKIGGENVIYFYNRQGNQLSFHLQNDDAIEKVKAYQKAEGEWNGEKLAFLDRDKYANVVRLRNEEEQTKRRLNKVIEKEINRISKEIEGKLKLYGLRRNDKETLIAAEYRLKKTEKWLDNFEDDYEIKELRGKYIHYKTKKAKNKVLSEIEEKRNRLKSWIEDYRNTIEEYSPKVAKWEELQKEYPSIYEGTTKESYIDDWAPDGIVPMYYIDVRRKHLTYETSKDLKEIEELENKLQQIHVQKENLRKDLFSELEFLKTPQGVVYGWTDGKKVYLTEEGMNPETPIHEYTHLWARAMMQGNAEGWQSVKDLLRGTPIWNEVMNDANYAEIHENEDAVASECLARLSGRENARRMEAEAQKMIAEADGVMEKANAVTLIERMKRALKKFWSWVGKNLFDIKSSGSIEEVTDRVLWDLVNNSELEIKNSELSEEDRQAIENMPIPMLKRQIKDTATTLFNVSQTSDQWQAENKDKIERAKLLLAYAKQELARKERLKKSNKWGVKVGNTATPFDVVRKMFEEFNSNEDLAQLFEKVAKVVETLPIKVVFSDTIGGKSTQGWFSPTTGTLKLPGYFVYGGGISEQNKAETILHEMIHAITTYALYINEKPYLQTELGFRLSDDMHAAIRQLKRIYASIANDKDFKGEYGAVSVHEMVAELSNVQFREKLKKKGLWETIVDAIKQLFGITPSNALEGAEAALEYMLNNFDRSQWEKMAGMGEKRGKQMRIGVDKMGSSFEYFTGTLTDLISIAKNAVKGLFKKNITPVSSRLVGDLKELGIDISEEYKHVVDNYAIRHTFNNHGGKGESLRGQIPINNSDFELIPDIVNNYDNITTIVTRKGLPGILYEKTFEDGTTVYVEEIHNKHKELTLVSMRKIKRPTLLGANRTNEPTPIPSSGKSSASKGSDNIGDVQGLEDYSAEELKEIAREYIEDVIAESGFDAEVVDLAIYGSRRRGDAREDSDLDIVVEYRGKEREDDLFNALNDVETQLEIGGVKVDINPITKGKSGSLGEFMARSREYDESIGSTKESQPLTNPSAFGTSPKTGAESEGSLEDDGLLFRDGDVFYSNAEEAVRNIKQEKATPEQWLAMIQKNGGLKAGEDKWLGLSDWLKSKMPNKQSTPSSQGGTPPKQGSRGELTTASKTGERYTLTKEEVLEFIAQNKIEIEEVGYGGDSIASAQSEFDELAEELGGYDEAFEEMVNRYGDDFREAVWYDEVGQLHLEDGYEYYGEILGVERGINRTRLDYTTEGLENKKEIALVVPSVDPYNQHDEIHFGDAGGGRAVAWVRFGETTDENGNRVLVIDEIQSKRHQDGREKGYISDEVLEAQRQYNYLYKKMYKEGLSEEEHNRYYFLGQFIKENYGIIPDAPFEKNWHELAMKRMLRYAAENGFDKVAWTTGAQQAERYDLGNVVNRIESQDTIDYDSKLEVDLVKQVVLFTRDGNAITLRLTPEGIVRASSQYNGHHISNIVGKELGNRIMTETDLILKEQDLRIGGEGMKGFYDKMLPSFMNKYGKKWGVKVGETTMPNIGDAGLTMHSIDVTDAMKESVMEGQPMFRDGESVEDRIEALFNQAISGEFKGKPISIGRLTDEGKEYLEQISGASFRENVDFVLNPSDLMHIYKDHFGNNEKDKGQNIPLDIEDIRSLADVISRPDKVIFFKEGEGSNRNMFYFFKEAEDGTYNLMEIYSDRKGNLTAKTFYKTRKDATQRVMDIEKSLLPTSETYSGAILSDAKIPQMFESTSVGNEISAREGVGAYTDAEVSMANDPIAKVMGRSERSKKQQAKFAERERKAMRNRVAELTERLHLENVEVVENSQLTPSPLRGTPPKRSSEGELNTAVGDAMSARKARAKGWFDTKTGKIVINISNHTSVADVERTLLHEAVAHYGLRELFGKQFDTFLDNVFQHAEADIRAQIVELAKKHGWNFRTATEEYLASLAENTNFEALENNWSWLAKIKQLFMDMLESIGWDYKGAELSDNELRYLLWRSYENMVNPGRHRSILGMAEDVAKQNELKVGNYSAEVAPMSQVADEGELYSENKWREIQKEESNRQFAKVKELLTALKEAGHNDFHISRSVTDWGVSTYLQGDAGTIYEGIKYRISDHSVSSPRRVIEERMIDYSTSANDIVAEVTNFKKMKENSDAIVNQNERAKEEKRKLLDEKWERIKHHFDGLGFYTNERTYQNFDKFASDTSRSNILQTDLGDGAFRYEYAAPKNGYQKTKPSYDYIEAFDEVNAEIETTRFKEDESVGEKSVKNVVVDMNTAPKSRKEAIELLSTMQQPFHNADQDADIYVSNRDARHSMQFRNDAQIYVFGALPKIIESAVKIGNVDVVEDEKNTTKSVSIYYCPINVDGVQYSGRMVVKEYYNGTHVLDELHLYNILLKEATPDAQNASSQGVPVHPSSVTEYKVKELIHNSQEQDKELLGINETTLFRDSEDSDIRFRDGESDGTREAYNKRVRRPNKRGDVGKWGNLSFRIREAYQDSMLSLDALQKVVMEKYGLTEIPSWMNAYMQENLMSSRNKAQSDIYMRDFYNPMMEAVQSLIKAGATYEDIKNYMIAKHGLERNKLMAEREAERVANDVLPEKYQGKPLEELDLELQNKWKEKYQEALAETRNKDYSGLTALTGEEDVATAEGKAQLMVDAFEKNKDYAKDDKVNKLWEKVNKATKATLRKTYEGGIIDADTYRQTAEMYEYYIPLRGWDDDIASDVYTYMNSSRPMLSPAMKTAKGRSSLADDPIATIGLMAESTIAQANRNAMKQAFYFFALNNPSDVVTIGKQWYIKNEVTFLTKTCSCYHFSSH